MLSGRKIFRLSLLTISIEQNLHGSISHPSGYDPVYAVRLNRMRQVSLPPAIFHITRLLRLTGSRFSACLWCLNRQQTRREMYRSTRMSLLKIIEQNLHGSIGHIWLWAGVSSLLNSIRPVLLPVLFYSHEPITSVDWSPFFMCPWCLNRDNTVGKRSTGPPK